MAAVVKIKRCLDEDPLETLILNCKRRKTNGSENNTNEELSAVLQLAGTSKEDESIEHVIRKRRLANASDLKRQFKKHDVDISKKIRSEIQDHSKNTRYRVVNCFRKNFNDELHEEPGKSNNEEVTVFELETDYNKNSTSTENKNKETDQSKYVYDFYYTSSDDFGEADIEDYVSVYPLNDPLLFGSVRDNGLNESDSEYESEDSNAENNWKNDYPDEEDLESINENDMIYPVSLSETPPRKPDQWVRCL
ncbi:probable RNA polymerase II nuclear localization protein SLC7A6OS isoform X2 [Sitophilus oryzae]|uniref:Probable RNA polymerase II nuclear localization protein SLC7A6OS n=1 Tax=Sitophilus oryzae TaxID=7048 RepID=A0A6J2YBU3_SITOR|nr:probable RNA polymerase II nuclear localization protein SLC7A6OS isoform X2 [Sitophilus oryzae]